MRPMLACNDTVLTNDNYDRITYPVFASTKLDGRRNTINAVGTSLSRTGKLLPNLHTRKVIQEARLIGLDGELLASSPTDYNAMQKAHSAFSSIGGEPDFTFHIFDDWRRGKVSFKDYWVELESRIMALPEWATIVPQTIITSPSDLAAFVQDVTNQGYEGAVIRSLNSPYKHGRSTWKQGWMLKAKEYTYDEGVIISLKEALHNANEAELDELGYTKRSSHRIGKVPSNTLGSFVVRFGETLGKKIDFGVSTGHLDAGQKKAIWFNRNDPTKTMIGSLITFKHFVQSGVRNKPRHAQFVSPRDVADMS